MAVAPAMPRHDPGGDRRRGRELRTERGRVARAQRVGRRAASGTPSASTPPREQQREPGRGQRPASRATATTSPARAPDRSTGAPALEVAERRHGDGQRLRDGQVAADDAAAGRQRGAGIPQPVGDALEHADRGVGRWRRCATTSAVGRAPIAATSARFVAAAFQPRSCGVDQASRKSGPWIIMSVVTT